MDREPSSIRPADLLQLWQQRADYLHEFGDPNSARLWRTAAVELSDATLKRFEALFERINRTL